MRLTATGRRYHESCLARSKRCASRRTTSPFEKRAQPQCQRAAFAAIEVACAAHQSWQKTHPDISVYLDGSHAEPSPDVYEIDFRISYGDRIDDAGTSIELFRDSVVPVCSPQILPRKGMVR